MDMNNQESLFLDCKVGDCIKIPYISNDGVWFDINKGYITFLVNLHQPTQEEIEGFETGELTFGFCFIFSALIGAVNFKNLGWYEGTFFFKATQIVHKKMNKPDLDYAEESFQESQVYTLVLLLVDSSMGKLVGKRKIPLNPEVIPYFKECINKQKIVTSIMEEELESKHYTEEAGLLDSFIKQETILKHLKYIHKLE